MFEDYDDSSSQSKSVQQGEEPFKAEIEPHTSSLQAKKWKSGRDFTTNTIKVLAKNLLFDMLSCIVFLDYLFVDVWSGVKKVKNSLKLKFSPILLRCKQRNGKAAKISPLTLSKFWPKIFSLICLCFFICLLLFDLGWKLFEDYDDSSSQSKSVQQGEEPFKAEIEPHTSSLQAKKWKSGRDFTTNTIKVLAKNQPCHNFFWLFFSFISSIWNLFDKQLFNSDCRLHIYRHSLIYAVKMGTHKKMQKQKPHGWDQIVVLKGRKIE